MWFDILGSQMKCCWSLSYQFKVRWIPWNVSCFKCDWQSLEVVSYPWQYLSTRIFLYGLRISSVNVRFVWTKFSTHVNLVNLPLNWTDCNLCISWIHAHVEHQTTTEFQPSVTCRAITGMMEVESSEVLYYEPCRLPTVVPALGPLARFAVWTTGVKYCMLCGKCSWSTFRLHNNNYLNQ